MAHPRRNMPVQPADHLMGHGFFLMITILFSFIFSTNIHAYACNQTERNSLLSFVLTLSSPSLNWTSINCCNWDGITCNQDGWVTHVHLPSKGLKFKTGTSPSFSLSNLTHLTHLNLSHNSLYGTLDQTGFFFSLNHLETLDLSNNHLSGELLVSLPSRIRTVDLSSNHFHGAISSSFFRQARNLTSFSVSNNTFSGSIPTSICLHSSPLIRLLDFSINKFNGSISRGLGECSKLQVLYAGHNNFSGVLPEDMYNATKLEQIALPFNSIYGAINDKVVNLTNLAILDLYFNKLSGVLPIHFGKLSKLKFLHLSFNNLEGFLPPSLMNCTNLVEIDLGLNNLEGNISTLNFSKLSQLTKLDLRKNHFTGMFPISLYSCKSLKAIELSYNDLEGQIQPEILSLKSLSFLSVGLNGLSNVTGALKILMGCKTLVFLSCSTSFVGEKMPTADDIGMVDYDGFKNLRVLYLSHCDLTGEIPIWLYKLKKLEILDLSYNRITGSLPSWLGNLPRLFSIDLSYNLISGEFPKELCRLPMLVSQKIAAQVDHNYLELSIFIHRIGKSTQQYNCLSSFPSLIYLDNNSISGNIPTEIGQLQLLQRLSLASNHFSGIFPDQISNLKNLEQLDLSMNHLSGTIPASMASLNFLSDFNVSYNNLEGPIPTSSQLQGFNASAFEGNSKLYGAPLPNHECGSTGDIDTDTKNSQDVDTAHWILWFYISVALGFITGFWGVVGPLMLKKTWRYAYFQFLDNIQDKFYVMMRRPD